MRTNVKVNSENNGTLKMKKENMLRSFFAVMVLSLVSMVGMSFTSNDTTRANDTVVKNALVSVVSDDNGTIVLISPANNISIRRADMVMDANFRMSEARNRKMAVAFGKMVAEEANAADEQMSENLNRSVLVSQFNQSMSNNVKNADLQMDEMANDEAEVKAKTVAFKSSMNNQITTADEGMDLMLNLSTIKNVKPSVAEEADKKMDALMSVKNISPKAGTDADAAMDLLINKN
jgi:hypothetical protein